MKTKYYPSGEAFPLSQACSYDMEKTEAKDSSNNENLFKNHNN